MRVLYDIAVLGLGHYQNRARTGIFRVVENVALELARMPELSLQFCASSVPACCDEYLRSRAELAHIPLQTTPMRMGLSRLQEALIKDVAASKPGWNLWRVMRGCIALQTEILARQAPMLAQSHLEGVGIFHSPFYPFPAVTRRKSHVRRFLTVYDLIAILRPDLFEPHVTKLIRKTLASLTPDDWVVCISEATRRDLLEFRPDLDPNRVRVTHLAAADHFQPDMREDRWAEVKNLYGLPEQPYMLTLSTLEPRKNIGRVVRCFGKLAADGKLGDMKLVLVGTKGWMMESIFSELEFLGMLRDRVVITGFVPDRDLAPIYSHAAVFVYPSLLEGFGLPPLEAMQCGVPVITSNTSSLPEVVADAGLTVSPTDEAALSEAMIRMYEDTNLRQSLALKARERAATFSWRRCAAETLEAYECAVRS